MKTKIMIENHDRTLGYHVRECNELLTKITTFPHRRRLILKRVNSANAIIFDESTRNVLLVKNGTAESNYWSFPGGEVEDSETLEQAVVREVREETGLNIEIGGLYSVREVFFKDKNEHALIFTFLTKIVDGELRISDPDNEILEVKWVDINTANKLMPYIPNHLNLQEDRKINFTNYYFHGIV
jgi:8-oxo-dGTP diphosphatase